MFKVIREKCGDWLDGYTQISTKKGEHICAWIIDVGFLGLGLC